MQQKYGKILVKKQKGFTVKAEAQRDFDVEFKRVIKPVEDKLTKSPVRIPGMGLPEEFHKLFDDIPPEEKARIKQQRYFRNKQNQQIKIDMTFAKGHKLKKNYEDELFEEMKEYLKPVS